MEKKAGASPGTLVYVGKERSGPVRWSTIIYNAKDAKEIQQPALESLPGEMQPGQRQWIRVQGVHDVDFIAKLGAQFGIHPLALEDVVNTHQRPKVDDYGAYLFFVLRHVKLGTDIHSHEQVSVILGKDFVISFEEDSGNLFEAILSRLSELKGRLPVLGSDYLCYRLLDCIVDSYFHEVTNLEEQLDRVEGGLLSGQEKTVLESIFKMRQETVALKKAISPLRDFATFFRNSDTNLLSEEIGVFLMDFSDHVTRVTESIESCRESLAVMMDLYISQSDRKLNEVMKVLTVISTIFIPLGFLTSYFGMNFKGMFEYDLPFGYPVFVSLLLLIVVFQLVMFRRRRWL